MEGKQIRIFIDDELMIEREDDSDPIGGYAIRSTGMRINQFEITDISGAPLLVEDFSTLNNWNARSGWELENQEIVVTDNMDSSLIYDINFSGYDYIAIDTFKRGQVQTNEEYIEELSFVINKTNDQAESDEIPCVIIAEFGGSIMEEIGWIDVDDRAKIGGGSIILPGVRVGKDSLIGAGSVVTKDVLPGKVVYGNPAREVS